MKIKRFLSRLPLLLFVVSIPFAYSCGFFKTSKSRRQNVKVEQKARKAEAKAYNEKVEAHRDRQSDETKAMMKKTKKKNKKMLKQFRKKKYWNEESFLFA